MRLVLKELMLINHLVFLFRKRLKLISAFFLAYRNHANKNSTTFEFILLHEAEKCL